MCDLNRRDFFRQIAKQQNIFETGTCSINNKRKEKKRRKYKKNNNFKENNCKTTVFYLRPNHSYKVYNILYNFNGLVCK